MELIDIVRKLAGPIDPVGETNTDEARFQNLKKVTELVETLLTDISKVSQNMDRFEYSMRRAGEYAFTFLNECAQSMPENGNG